MTGNRGFTARHMLAAMLAFFGVVIAVNVTMAVFATRTFGGTVVDNSYVASQRFNRWLAQGRAQERLGWTAQLALDESRHVRVALADRIGAMEAAEIEAVARHPLGRQSDLPLRFRPAGAGLYRSDRPLPHGRWQVHLEVRRGSDELRAIETLS